MRISDVYNTKDHSLWGKDQISPKDVKQGLSGDCWLHAAASAIASDPQRVKDMFLTHHLNSAGVYAMKLYVLGVPVTVTVDE